MIKPNGYHIYPIGHYCEYVASEKQFKKNKSYAPPSEKPTIRKTKPVT